jgi:hypothetical protein
MKETSEEVINELSKILDATPKKNKTMTPKEKAKELVDKFSAVPLLDSYEAKQCALVAVDEIIKAIKIADNITFMYVIDYYQEVKQEIEKL